MPAYVAAFIKSITDKEAYARYVAQVEATLAPYGGRFLARKPDPEVLEGGPAPSRAIILEFPGVDEARDWHASPAYQPVAEMRRAASDGLLLLLPPATAHPMVAMHDVCYVEWVSSDIEATRRTCEALHGWKFALPAPELGAARVATLRSGTLCAVRAPMSAEETPVTRAYVRVPDIEAAAKHAAEHGAAVILPPTEIEGRGRIAIWTAGGLQHGAWELPVR